MTPDTTRQRARRGYLKWVFQCAVSVALIAYIVQQIDLTLFVRLLAGADKRFFALILIIAVLERLVMAWRQFLLLKAQAVHPRFGRLLVLVLVSNSLGSFLPGSVGNDLFKAYGLISRYANPSHVISAIVMDRLLGFLSLTVLALAAMLFVLHLMVDATRMLGWFAVLFLLLIAFTAVLFLADIRRHAIRFQDRKAVRGLVRILDRIRDYQGHKGIVFGGFLLSMGMQVLRVLQVYWFGLAVGTTTGFGVFLCFVPIIFLIKQLPVSINGIGVSQGLYVFFFGKVGMPRVEAFTISTGVMLFGYLLILAGGVLYLFFGMGLTEKEADRERKVDVVSHR